MKRIVLTFGLISGTILAVTMLVSMSFIDQIGDRAEILGYATMVAAFLMVYFGIRSFRDNSGGVISFGKAFQVGILITLIATVCYVASWEVIYNKMVPDFGDKYAAKQIEKARASNASQAEIDGQVKAMEKFKVWYRNPLMRIPMTFVEPFPLGLLITLVSAGILRRKTPSPSAGGALETAVQG